MEKHDDLKINNLSIDEWIDKGEKKTSPNLQELEKYDFKNVAFLDLLAMKDLVYNEKDDSAAIQKMKKIKGIIDIETKSIALDPDFILTHFSDSFIFTCSEKHMLDLVSLLATIQMRILVECQFQLRGAVTYGKVKVTDAGKDIIGPAYIDAFKLEQKSAIYPRIIIHNNFLDKFCEKHPNSSEIILTTDNEKIIDYLGHFVTSEEKNKKSKEEIILFLKREKVFRFLSERYAEFKKKNDHAIKQKYGWTIQYFLMKGIWHESTNINW
ncbi:MAG: hypothetical protein PHW04_11580 [Candidatus Wallbacteria bacterium]|nr:hypothetical protein [Candidatus Wallbacteria bacterium]